MHEARISAAGGQPSQKFVGCMHMVISHLYLILGGIETSFAKNILLSYFGVPYNL